MKLLTCRSDNCKKRDNCFLSCGDMYFWRLKIRSSSTDCTCENRTWPPFRFESFLASLQGECVSSYLNGDVISKEKEKIFRKLIGSCDDILGQNKKLLFSAPSHCYQICSLL